MRKQTPKIKLHRETLHALEIANLQAIGGGFASAPPVCENSGNAINHCSTRC